ncbi:glucuronate isomerase, partial [Escherichia coli]|nr:glucuronate isomerase [Escherichia coli]
MKNFLCEDFLLSNETARRLYHEHALHQPIYDYHCHLNPAEVAQNRQFDNLGQIWLEGDHYKWRGMRSAGIEERLITGDASDYDKYMAWAKTVPQTLGNPLYHWTHLELRRPFGITNTLLSPDT